MLAAKAVVIGAVAFVAGVVAAAVVVPRGTATDSAQGQYVLPVSLLTEIRVWAGAGLLLGVAAVFALAVGAAMRRSAAAVTTVIVLTVLPFLLAATVLPTAAGDWLLRFTPDAGFAIMQSTPAYTQVDAAYLVNAGYYPLAPWAGFAVLCLYAALALGLALFLLRRRDA